MAFPNSYVSGKFLQDAVAGTSFNLDTNTVRVSAFTDAVSGANKEVAETYNSGAWTSTNEVGTARTLTNPTLTTPGSGEWIFKDSVDTLTWTGVTGTIAGVLVYSNTASNRVIAAIKLATPVALVVGDFTLTWDDSTIFRVTY